MPAKNKLFAVFLFAALASLAFAAEDSFPDHFFTSRGLIFQSAPGKITFFKSKDKSANKADFTYLRGSLTRVFPEWQKIARIQHKATSSLQAKPVSASSHFDEEMLRQKTQTFFLEKSGKKLFCSYRLFSRSEKNYYLDFCYMGPNSENLAEKLVSDFSAHLDELPAEFDQRPFLFEPSDHLPAIRRPEAFFHLKTENNRAWLLDSSGLVEAEFFFEPISAYAASGEGEELYQKSVEDSLSRQGWAILGRQAGEHSQCLLLQRSVQKKEDSPVIKSSGNYCYGTATINKNRFRLVFLTVFNPEYADQKILAGYQNRELAAGQN